MKRSEARYVKDLPIGAVIRDDVRGLRRSYKILSKSPGAVYCLKVEQYEKEDTSVMPPKIEIAERQTKLHIAPTARLADFGTRRASGEPE